MNVAPKNEFTHRLLRWYQRHGRQSLPWSKHRSPYRVWVSEIMLQQTQVQTVLQYFPRFIARFPSLKQLAIADENEVLAHWSGLGYYRRARHMHQGAQIIWKNQRGRFPRTLADLMALPGIGRSTAGAILSLAMNQPTPILDGNVKRVLSRIHGISEDLNQPHTLRTLWDLASTLTPNPEHCADYTQAIMDFGATQCIRSPHCANCPMQSICAAHKNHQVAKIPYKPSQIKVKTQTMHCLVLHHGNAMLLMQRPTSGIWAKLWCPPLFENASEAKNWCKRHALAIAAYRQGPSFTHLLTHRRLKIETTYAQLNKMPDALPIGPITWHNGTTPRGGIPKIVDKLHPYCTKQEITA